MGLDFQPKRIGIASLGTHKSSFEAHASLWLIL